MTQLASSCLPDAPLSADHTQIARHLNTHLGPTLVALLADVPDRRLPRRWAEGDATPTDSSEARLVAAHHAWQEIASAETDHIARAWFIGTNPQLGELAPVEALRLGCTAQVMAAASQFVTAR
jgi:hypothetical protein